MASSSTTSPINKEKPFAATSQQPQTAVPRKRRRRTPITNATEDCSNCRKRQTACDRVRPYCTQCVKLGKECPGYKTTLTWGVGVASRGKLRGLSLPIANSSKAPGPHREPRRQTVAAVKPPVSKTEPSLSTSDPTTSGGGNVFLRISASAPDIPSFNLIPPTTTYASNAFCTSPSHSSWDMGAGYQDHISGSVPYPTPLRPRPLQRVQTTLASYEEVASPTSTTSWSDAGFPSPSEYPHSPESVPVWDPWAAQHAYGNQQSPSISSVDGMSSFLEPPRSCPPLVDDMSSSISSDQSASEPAEVSSIYVPGLHSMSIPDAILHGPSGLMLGNASYGAFSCSPDVGALPAGSLPPQDSTMLADLASHSSISSIPKSIGSFGFPHLAPRMHYLLRHYETAICPFLSAVEDQNPYICHIVPLVPASESLQNAIAALSLNNIRMRAIKSMESSGYPAATAQGYRDTIAEPSQEELSYKAASIDILNVLLREPGRAKDDSVLATLLILCLYHCCDSGFSKFRTQLVGVQKLLNMRDRTRPTEFTRWVEMFFTWFDVLTSTVNDREAEIQSESIEMLDLSVTSGLEYHAGCDLRLFKTIARLGRLNLLSQNRPVRERNTQTTPRGPKVKDFYSLGGCNSRPTTPSGSISSPVSQASPGIPRNQFWTEWLEIRHSLQTWELDIASSLRSSAGLCSATPPVLTSQQHDVLHINEAFRYSALLYIERLAKPTLPSSSLDFQNLVAQSLYHITEIGIHSFLNKFLLWPLFITGTEVVDDGHRSMLAERCIAIQQESGFFNNLSALEVLEKAWRQEDEGVTRDGDSRQAFRWRHAMDRADGEYIII